MENNEEEKTLTPQEKLAEFQAQKMTRRQALGRFGFLAGAAAVAALSVDELTRLAGNEMSRRAAGNKAVEQVAKELQNAGVAEAIAIKICFTGDGEPFWCKCNNGAALGADLWNQNHGNLAACQSACNGAYASGGENGYGMCYNTPSSGEGGYGGPPLSPSAEQARIACLTKCASCSANNGC
jgi:hypothetical protein